MDATFERMMYHRMINSSCRAKLPQYFLVTPKLLPDLQYDKNVTISFIFNSSNVLLKSRDLSTNTYMKRKRRNEASTSAEVETDTMVTPGGGKRARLSLSASQ